MKSVIKIKYQVVSNIKCAFAYDYTRKNINIIPDTHDLESASLHDILRFWYLIGEWVKVVGVTHREWHIGGEYLSEEDQLHGDDIARDSGTGPEDEA